MLCWSLAFHYEQLLAYAPNVSAELRKEPLARTANHRAHLVKVREGLVT